MEPFVGQVISVGFNFAPIGWLACNGQLVPISEYEVLFNLIGTTYGGNGTTNFGVPDLRGRTPLCMGQAAGLSTYVLGQMAGAESVTLTANQIGSHNHTLLASAQAAAVSVPTTSTALGIGSQTALNLYAVPPASTTLNGGSIGSPVGAGNLPHENRQPYLAVNYIIAYAGVFPSQS
ncbi:MAG: tail fiber protein [Acetobacteraceae bacterium]|nr:tail fiber protein [Acetobacteraceae bacterium]